MMPQVQIVDTIAVNNILKYTISIKIRISTNTDKTFNLMGTNINQFTLEIYQIKVINRR